MITIVIALEGLLLASLPFTPWVWLAVMIQFLIGMGIAANELLLARMRQIMILNYFKRQTSLEWEDRF